MSVIHGLYYVRTPQDTTKPVSVAYQTARRLCVHAELDHGQDGTNASGVKCQSPHQRQVKEFDIKQGGVITTWLRSMSVQPSITFQGHNGTIGLWRYVYFKIFFFFAGPLSAW